MAKSELIKQRFVELTSAASKIPIDRGGDGFPPDVKKGDFNCWATSAINLVKGAFGADSDHYKNIRQAYEAFTGYPEDLNAMVGVFRGAQSDFEGGYCFDLEAQISGEVLGDFVALAKAALSEQQKDVAAVLACAALEDALKRCATKNGLSVDGKEMQEVVNALKSKGVVSGAQKPILDAMPKLRNSAMHADWSKISLVEVSSVIGFVEQFLIAHFS